MHVTRILPETFKPMTTASTYTGPNYWVMFSVGDVEANGILYKGMAIRVHIRKDDEHDAREIVFKGKDRIEKVTNWLYALTNGHWSDKQHNWLDIMAGDDE
jgi:hypothetical protein